MLMKVYSPEGDMFEVAPHRAKFLTLNKGWTFSRQPVPLFKENSPLNGSSPTEAPVVEPTPVSKPPEPEFAEVPAEEPVPFLPKRRKSFKGADDGSV